MPLRITRIIVGATLAAAVAWNLPIALDAGGTVGNYFSFFTIISNTAAAVLLLVQGVQGRTIGPRVRGAITLYMAITGLVYVLLLRGVDVQTVGWVNTAVHYVGPAYLVLDWLIDRPAEPVPLRAAATWLLVPAAYTAYSLVRGPLVDWYPYPFLDPRVDGYGAVAVWSVVILIAFSCTALALRWLADLGRDRAPTG